MVGFPGETEAEFQETYDFIAQSSFTYLHVFTFSAREGTPAAAMPGQVPKAVKKERNRLLRELAERKNAEFRARMTGREVDAVTLDRFGPSGQLVLSDNFLHVEVAGSSKPPAQLIRVRL